MFLKHGQVAGNEVATWLDKGVCNLRKDILGRELHDGDVCVGKGTGRYVAGMDVGVWSGKSIAFRGGGKRSMGDVFLVVNPSKEELEIKEEIEKSLSEIEAKRKEKASISTIPLSKLQVGGVYKCNNGQTYIYLGKRKVILDDCYRSHDDIAEGHCFVYVNEKWSDDEIKENILNVNTYRRTHNIDVLKGNKKLTELIRCVDLTFPMVNEVKRDGYDRYCSEYHYKLTVE